MDQVVIVTYPIPITLEAQPIEHEATPEGAVAMAYYYRRNMIARGVLAPEAVPVVRRILAAPVTLALAAAEDEQGNIDARVCLVIPVESELLRMEDPDPDDEPWRASVPPPPFEIESSWPGRRDPSDPPQMALLPLGNVIRAARHRNHPKDVAGDAREMLDNLVEGRAQDAVARAIDDLLESL